MNIKKRLRELLSEAEQNRKNKYGCVMVFLDIKGDVWGDIQKLIETKDLYTDPDDPSFGRETKPHVTGLFGLHEDVTDKEIEDTIKGFKKPKMALNDVSFFTSDKYDVLKFDVESKDMHDINKELKKFPYTSDFPNYHPHCTIAYLKKDSAEKYCKLIKKKVYGRMECMMGKAK